MRRLEEEGRYLEGAVIRVGQRFHRDRFVIGGPDLLQGIG